MREYISEHLRKIVAERARHRCEYCLIQEDDTYSGCHVDHIISIKHGGTSDAENLAYACAFCNRAKGSDIGSILWKTGEFVRFFNPRKDKWAEHFIIDGELIKHLTSIGEATLQILRFNDTERIEERKELIATGRYSKGTTGIYEFKVFITQSNRGEHMNPVIEKQIETLNDLKKFLKQFNENMETASTQYQKYLDDLADYDLDAHIYERYQSEFLDETKKRIADIVDNIETNDIPYIEKLIEHFENTPI